MLESLSAELQSSKRASVLECEASARMQRLRANAEPRLQCRGSDRMQSLSSNAKPQVECKASARMQRLSAPMQMLGSNAAVTKTILPESMLFCKISIEKVLILSWIARRSESMLFYKISIENVSILRLSRLNAFL